MGRRIDEPSKRYLGGTINRRTLKRRKKENRSSKEGKTGETVEENDNEDKK